MNHAWLRRARSWRSTVIPRRGFRAAVWVAVASWLLAFEPALSIALKIAAACVYGLYRGGSWHPFSDYGYREWLKATPWTPSRPLPFGNAYLSGQDLLLVGAVALLGYGWSVLVFAAMLYAFVFAWLFRQTLFFLMSTTSVYFYFMLWAWGGLLLGPWMQLQWLVDWSLDATAPWKELGALGAYAAGMCVVAWFGVRRAMRRFPWESTSPPSLSRLLLSNERIRLAGREDTLPELSPLELLAPSALVGWLSYCAIEAIPRVVLNVEQKGLVIFWSLVILAVGLLSIVYRLSSYASGTRPPVSVLGRFVSKRLIVPGYDVIYVIPLAMAAAIAAAIAWFSRVGVTPLSAALSASGFALLALWPYPNLRRWRLTGHFSMASFVTDPVAGERQIASPQRLSFPTWCPVRTYSPQTYWMWKWMTGFGLVLLLGTIIVLLLGAEERWATVDKDASVMFFLVTVGGAYFYSASRVKSFHPLQKPHYSEWLKYSPWHKDKPLPLGPVAPCKVDLFPIGVLTLLCAVWVIIIRGVADVAPSRVLLSIVRAATVLWMLMVLFYLIKLSGKLWRTGQESTVLVLGFLFGALILLFPRGRAMALVLLLGLLLALRALRRSWKAFPWKECWYARSARHRSPSWLNAFLLGQVWLAETPDDPPLPELLRKFSPKSLPETLPTGQRVARILLAGWLSFVPLCVLPSDGQLFVWLVYLVLVLVTASSRLALYQVGYSEPLGMVARIFTRRLILPRYDRIYLAPLAIVLAGAAVPSLLWLAGVPVSLALPAGLVTILTIAAFAGPSLRNWRLTGGWQAKQ